jgi:hypothetical protein
MVYDLESPHKIKVPLPISHISKFKPWELIAGDDLFEQNSDFVNIFLDNHDSIL